MNRNPIPWTERMSPFRAPLDILSGSYPGFIFGGSLSSAILPVFHFHEVTPGYLEPYLKYLSENDYRCANTDEFLAFIENGKALPARTVLLTFDDAWTSLWTVAAPLLRRYGLRAITFAVPGRVSDVEGIRDTIENNPAMTEFGDRSDEPFCRWDELLQLDQGGVVEVESHTFAHEQIPVDRAVEHSVWTEEKLQLTPLLSKPLVWEEEKQFRPFDEREVGRLQYITRSRMSDARKWIEAEGRSETEEEARESVRRDLSICFQIMTERFNRKPRTLCFPWAVAGEMAREEAKAVGYRAGFSDSFPGKRFVHAGSDPFRLMRLKHNWIYHLPGKGRRRVPLPK